MKMLVSPGVSLVKGSRYSRVADLLAVSSRHFPPTAPAVDPSPPFNVDLHFTLADGHTYAYTYQGLGDAVADDRRARLLEHDYTPGVVEPAGGKLFNGSVRQTCLNKLLVF